MDIRRKVSPRPRQHRHRDIGHVSDFAHELGELVVEVAREGVELVGLVEGYERDILRRVLASCLGGAGTCRGEENTFLTSRRIGSDIV